MAVRAGSNEFCVDRLELSVYLYVLTKDCKRISYCLKLDLQTVLCVMLFGGFGLVRLLIHSRFRLSHHPHPAFVDRWTALKIADKFDFAFTGVHDATYLNKVIFLCHRPRRTLYKTAFDSIFQNNLLNEYEKSRNTHLPFSLKQVWPCVIETPFRVLLPVTLLSRNRVIRVINAYTTPVPTGHCGEDRELRRALVHGDLKPRNIKLLVACARLVLIDYEFCREHTVSYDYFYYYINDYLRRGNVAAVLHFARKDYAKELVLHGVAVHRQYAEYLAAFLEEWYAFFAPRSHDKAFAGIYRPVVDALIERISLSSELQERHRCVVNAQTI